MPIVHICCKAVLITKISSLPPARNNYCTTPFSNDFPHGLKKMRHFYEFRFREENLGVFVGLLPAPWNSSIPSHFPGGARDISTRKGLSFRVKRTAHPPLPNLANTVTAPVTTELRDLIKATERNANNYQYISTNLFDNATLSPASAQNFSADANPLI